MAEWLECLLTTDAEGPAWVQAFTFPSSEDSRVPTYC